MFNRNDPERKIRQVKGWRKLTAFLCAFVLLVSSSGLNAFAQTIYSDPVTVPVQNTDAPEETPAPAGMAEDGENAEPAGDEPAEIPGTDETGEPAEDLPAPETDGEQPVEADKEEPAAETGGNTDQEITEEPETVYFPGTLNLETAEGSVQVGYPAEACIPENTVLTLTAVKGAELNGLPRAIGKGGSLSMCAGA